MIQISYLDKNDIYDIGVNSCLWNHEDCKGKSKPDLFKVYTEMFYDNTYKTIEIPEIIKNYIVEIASIGNVTGKVSEIYEDEVEEIKQYFNKIEFPFERCFMKWDYYSPKDSIHWSDKILPFTNWDNIIKVILTSHRSISSLKYSNKMVLQKWNEHWKEKHEFRVFVWNGKITAISQYVPEYLNAEKEYDLVKLVNEIKDYFDDCICSFVDERFDGLKEYVFDVHVGLPDYTIEFIEFNDFYNSGTSCFNWLKDREIIMNCDGDINIRVVK